MRALIVDDSSDKIRTISKVFHETPGFDMSHLDTASNSLDARRLLMSDQYDLLVLDLALPERVDVQPSPLGGVDLLKEILERARYKKPGHIIGLSAYEESISGAEAVFEEGLWHVLRYNEASNDWREQLKRKVLYLLLREADPHRAAYKFDVALVCAMHEKELEPFLRFSWNWQSFTLEDDPSSTYWKGSFNSFDETRSIVAVAAPRMGLVDAAITATKLLQHFKPKYLVMPGITAGFKTQCNLGDVLVGDPCWNYESGKWAVSEAGNSFEPAPHQLPLSAALRGRIRRIALNEDFLVSVRSSWQAQKPDTAIRIHLGPLASGAAVRADGSAKQIVTEQHRQAIGLEMEAYAVMAAAAEGTLPEARAVVVKGVCDFADGEKHDGLQPYAAFVSAQVVKKLLEDELNY